MLKRTVAILVAGVVSVAGGPAALASDDGTTSDPPDVLLVIADDQRSDTLEFMPLVQQRIAGRGMTFANAFVVNALCCPSRASILTGLYSHSTGVYRQAPPFGRFESFDDASTLATWLDALGYRTGYFGKYIDGGQHFLLTGYVPPGWDEWAVFVHADYYDYKLSVNGGIESFGQEPEDYSTHVLAGRAADFIRTSGDDPLFMVFAPAAPHAPGTPAPEDADVPVLPETWRPPNYNEPDVMDKPPWLRAIPPLDEESRAALDAARIEQIRSLSALDRSVSLVLDELQAAGRLRRTLIVYSSDNGLAWGEHRWNKKEVPYEESIRVPFLVRYDPLVTTAGVEDRLVLNIDIAPTIARLAGVDEVAADGRSLLPLLRRDARTWRTDFLIEHLQGSNPVTTYCAVRTERFLYVRYRDGFTELYDLETDPFELTNVSGVAAFRQTESELIERLEELCQPPPPAVPPIFKDRGFSAGFAALLALVGTTVLGGLLVALTFRKRRAPA
jgi:arylsulfatase A-like enzyme